MWAEDLDPDALLASRRAVAGRITASDEDGGPVDHATFDLSAFQGSYCRVTVVDDASRRAWSNPIWP